MTCASAAAVLVAGQPSPSSTSSSLSPSLQSSPLLDSTVHPISNHHLATDIEDDQELENDEHEHDDCIKPTATTSPLLLNLGRISPVEELTPAIPILPASSSSALPVRRHHHLHSDCNSSTNTSIATPASVSSLPTTNSTSTQEREQGGEARTARLVLDWSRPHTSSAIFHSSSGVSRVHIQVREPQSRAQASIERLKWRVPAALLPSVVGVGSATSSSPGSASRRNTRSGADSPTRSPSSSKGVARG